MKTANIILEYQPYIQCAPVSQDRAHQQACSNDAVTIERWYDTWISQIKANHEKFGSFADNSIGKLYGLFDCRPMIVAGSGPSLKKNIKLLKDRPSQMGLISCLHNFHYMEDNAANVDLYVSLDAGDVTIDEVSEGGLKSPDEYWDLTKDRKLCCYIGTSPKLLEKWRGEIYFFNAPVPDDRLRAEISAIENFNCFVESGGNVLGAATFIAKGFLGSQVSIFIGADFSFSNENKRTFHAWDSKYDAQMGQAQRAVDVFGNTVWTWPSYYNFKLWFDVVSQRVPGIYINATEGGCMGAYREGNIMQIKQMDLANVFELFSLHSVKQNQATNPGGDNREVFM